MNPQWKQLLISLHASFNENNGISLNEPNYPQNCSLFSPLFHMSVLEVSGDDAQTFLQGQATCDFNDVTDNCSRLGAFCTAKGRVISTFIAIKQSDVFLLILPCSVLEAVKKHLQRYILRSNVRLSDETGKYALIGLHPSYLHDLAASRLINSYLNNNEFSRLLKWPGLSNRYLFIIPDQELMDFWNCIISLPNFAPAGSSEWKAADIEDGLPWISPLTIDEFIPQSLNLDELGAINFKKGCYTGQEIIARTHYRGKAKSHLYRARCGTAFIPAPGDKVITSKDPHAASVGQIVSAVRENDDYQLLVVLYDEFLEAETLQVVNPKQEFMSIIPRNTIESSL